MTSFDSSTFPGRDGVVSVEICFRAPGTGQTSVLTRYMCNDEGAENCSMNSAAYY